MGTELIRVKKVILKEHEKKRKKMEDTAKYFSGKDQKISWSKYMEILAKQPLYIPEGVIVKTVKKAKKKFK